jgi:hypothetical protein
MFAPWKIRVTQLGRPGSIVDGWFKAEVRIGQRWYDAGCAKSWWKAFWMGVCG